MSRAVQARPMGFVHRVHGESFKVTQVMKVTPPSQGTWVPDPWKAEGSEHRTCCPT